VRDAEQPSRELRRVVEFRKILIRLQEHILAEVKCIFTIRNQAQQIIEDTFLPSGNEKVVRLDVPTFCCSDQVAIFDFAKDQSGTLVTFGSARKDAGESEKV
jgi:hypothetical protein